MSLKARLTSDMKEAMRARESDRLGVIRLLLAAIKQTEVDSREDLDDAGVLAILEKQVKQRKESVRQYREAGREDLADKEQAEIGIIEPYLPAKLGADEVAALIDELIAATGAESMRDMGKVMGQLKARAQGQVDMAEASALIKKRLSG